MRNPFRKRKVSSEESQTAPTDEFPPGVPPSDTQNTQEAFVQTSKTEFPALEKVSTVDVSTSTIWEGRKPSEQRLSSANLNERNITDAGVNTSTITLPVPPPVATASTQWEDDRRSSDRPRSRQLSIQPTIPEASGKHVAVQTSATSIPLNAPKLSKSSWSDRIGDWIGIKSTNRLSTDPATRARNSDKSVQTSYIGYSETPIRAKLDRATSLHQTELQLAEQLYRECVNDLRTSDLKTLPLNTCASPEDFNTHHLKVNKPVVIFPADKPGLFFIPGITSLPLLAPFPVPPFFPPPPLPHPSLPLPPFGIPSLPLVQPLLQTTHKSSFPAPREAAAGSTCDSSQDLTQTRRKSFLKSLRSRRHKDQDVYCDSDHSSVLCIDPYDRANTHFYTCKCQANPHPAAATNCLCPRDETPAHKRRFICTKHRTSSNNKTYHCKAKTKRCVCQKDMDNIKHSPALHEPPTTFCPNCQCPYCCLPTCDVATSRCGIAGRNICHGDTVESNVTHVNASMFRCIQVCLRNSNTKKNQKVKKYNFDLETIQILGSLLAGTRATPLNCREINDCNRITECYPSHNRHLMDQTCSTTARRALIRASCTCGASSSVKQKGPISSAFKCLSFGRHFKQLMTKFDKDLSNLPNRCTSQRGAHSEENDKVKCSGPNVESKRYGTEDKEIKCNAAPFTCRRSDAMFTFCDDDMFTPHKCAKYYTCAKENVCMSTDKPGCYQSQIHCCGCTCECCRIMENTKEINTSIEVSSVHSQTDSTLEKTSKHTSPVDDTDSPNTYQPVAQENSPTQEETHTSTTADIVDIEDEFSKTDTECEDTEHSSKPAVTDPTDQNSNVATTDQQQETSHFVHQDIISETEIKSSDINIFPEIEDHFYDKRCILKKKLPCSDNKGQSVRSTSSRNDYHQTQRQNPFKCHREFRKDGSQCITQETPVANDMNTGISPADRCPTKERQNFTREEGVSKRREIKENGRRPEHHLNSTLESKVADKSPKADIDCKNKCNIPRLPNVHRCRECQDQNVDTRGKYEQHCRDTHEHQLKNSYEYDNGKTSVFCGANKKSAKFEDADYTEEFEGNRHDTRDYNQEDEPVINSWGDSKSRSVDKAEDIESSHINQTETGYKEKDTPENDFICTDSQRKICHRQVRKCMTPQYDIAWENTEDELQPCVISDTESSQTEDSVGIVYAMSNSKYNDTADGKLFGSTFSCKDNSQEQSTICDLPDLDLELSDRRGQQGLIKDISELLNMQASTNNDSHHPNHSARITFPQDEYQQVQRSNTFTCQGKRKNHGVKSSIHAVSDENEDKNIVPSSACRCCTGKQSDIQEHFVQPTHDSNRQIKQNECEQKIVAKSTKESRTFDSKTFQLPNAHRCKDCQNDEGDILRHHELHIHKGYIYNRKQLKIKREHDKGKVSIFCTIKKKSTTFKDKDYLQEFEGGRHDTSDHSRKDDPVNCPYDDCKSKVSSLDKTHNIQPSEIDKAEKDNRKEDKREKVSSKAEIDHRKDDNHEKVSSKAEKDHRKKDKREKVSSKAEKDHRKEDKREKVSSKAEDSIGIIYAMSNGKYNDTADGKLFGSTFCCKDNSQEQSTICDLPDLDSDISDRRGRQDLIKNVTGLLHREVKTNNEPKQSARITFLQEDYQQVQQKNIFACKRKRNIHGVESSVHAVPDADEDNNRTLLLTGRCTIKDSDFTSKGDFVQPIQDNNKQIKQNECGQEIVGVKSSIHAVSDENEDKNIVPSSACRCCTGKHGDIEEHVVEPTQDGNREIKQNECEQKTVAKSTKESRTFEQSPTAFNDSRIDSKTFQLSNAHRCKDCQNDEGDILRHHELHIHKGYIYNRKQLKIKREQNHSKVSVFCNVKRKSAKLKAADYKGEFEGRRHDERDYNQKDEPVNSSFGDSRSISAPVDKAEDIQSSHINQTETGYKEKDTPENDFTPENDIICTDSQRKICHRQVRKCMTPQHDIAWENTEDELQPCVISDTESSKTEDSVGIIYAMSDSKYNDTADGKLFGSTFSCKDNSQEQSTICDLPDLDLELSDRRGQQGLIKDISELLHRQDSTNKDSTNTSVYDSDCGKYCCSQCSPTRCQKSILLCSYCSKLHQNGTHGQPDCSCTNLGHHLLVCRPCSRQFGPNHCLCRINQHINLSRPSSDYASSDQCVACECCSSEDCRFRCYFIVKSHCNNAENSHNTSTPYLDPQDVSRAVSSTSLNTSRTEESSIPHTHSADYRFYYQLEESINTDSQTQHKFAACATSFRQIFNKFTTWGPSVLGTYDNVHSQGYQHRTNDEKFELAESFTITKHMTGSTRTRLCLEQDCRCNCYRGENNAEACRKVHNENPPQPEKVELSSTISNHINPSKQGIADIGSRNRKRSHRERNNTISRESNIDKRTLINIECNHGNQSQGELTNNVSNDGNISQRELSNIVSKDSDRHQEVPCNTVGNDSNLSKRGPSNIVSSHSNRNNRELSNIISIDSNRSQRELSTTVSNDSNRRNKELINSENIDSNISDISKQEPSSTVSVSNDSSTSKQEPSNIDSNHVYQSEREDRKHRDPSYADCNHEDRKHRDPSYADSNHEDRKHRDLSYADSNHEDMKHIDPSYANPNHENRKQRDPSYANPNHEDRKQRDQSYADFNHEDRKHIDPSYANPNHEDRKQRDPSYANPNHEDRKNRDASYTNSNNEDRKQRHQSYADFNHEDRKHIDPSYTNPNHEDRKQRDPSYANPNHENRKQRDPSYANPNHEDRKQRDPSYANPNHEDRKHIDPSYTNPNHEDRKQRDPSYANPNHEDRKQRDPSYANPNLEDRKHIVPSYANPSHEDRKQRDQSYADFNNEDREHIGPSYANPNHEDRKQRDPSYANPNHEDRKQRDPSYANPNHEDGKHKDPSCANLNHEDRKQRDLSYADFNHEYRKQRDPSSADSNHEDRKHRNPSYADSNHEDRKQRHPSYADSNHKDRKHIDPSYANSNHEDRKQRDPSYANPNHEDRKNRDPSYANLNHEDRKQRDPSYANPNHEDRKHIVPSYANPSHEDRKQRDQSYADFNNEDREHIDPNYANPNHEDRKQRDSSYANPNHEDRKQRDQSYANPNHEDGKHKDPSYTNPNHEDGKLKDPSYANLNHEDRKQRDLSYADFNHEDRKQRDPSSADSNHEDRKHRNPSSADSNHEDRKHRDPSSADSNHKDRKQRDPSSADSNHEDRKHTDPSSADSNHEDRKQRDPSYVDSNHKDRQRRDEYDSGHGESDRGHSSRGDESHEGYILSHSVSLSDSGKLRHETRRNIKCKIDQTEWSVHTEVNILPISNSSFHETPGCPHSKGRNEISTHDRPCLNCHCRKKRKKELKVFSSDKASAISKRHEPARKAYFCQIHQGPCIDCAGPEARDQLAQETSYLNKCPKVGSIHGNKCQNLSESQGFPSKMFFTSAPQKRKRKQQIGTEHPCKWQPSEIYPHFHSPDSSQLQVDSNSLCQDKGKPCSSRIRSPELFGNSFGSSDAGSGYSKCQSRGPLPGQGSECQSLSYQHDNYLGVNTKQPSSNQCPSDLQCVDISSKESSERSHRTGSSRTHSFTCSNRPCSLIPCQSCGQKQSVLGRHKNCCEMSSTRVV